MVQRVRAARWLRARKSRLPIWLARVHTHPIRPSALTVVGEPSKGDEMETFACKSLGLDCDFEVTGATREEVMGAAMEHGGTAHADLMANMTPDQMADFAKSLEAAIHAA